MRAPRVLVLRTAGTNCDAETAHAFLLAGAEVERLHVRALLDRRALLADFGALVVPGGFSYGDDLGAGTVLANQLRTRLADDVAAFVERDRLVLGICNGFQVLVRLGILPGPEGAASLVENESGRFEDRWVRLRVESGLCPLLERGSIWELPVAHKEGRFVPRSGAVLASLEAHGQVAFRYLEHDRDEPARGWPANPNGSTAAIAGVTNERGNVLGLMPHPERHVRFLHHPAWTRRKASGGVPRDEERAGDGFHLFRRAVEYLSA